MHPKRCLVKSGLNQSWSGLRGDLNPEIPLLSHRILQKFEGKEEGGIVQGNKNCEQQHWEASKKSQTQLGVKSETSTGSSYPSPGWDWEISWKGSGFPD